MNDSLTSRIRELAKKKGVSIRKLEMELGFADKTISAWDTHRPSVDRASAVADYFGVSVDWLLGRNELADDEDINAMLADPEYRALFKATAKLSKKDLEFVKRMIASINTDD